MTNNFRRFAFSKRGAFRLILFEIEVTKGIDANISIYIYIYTYTIDTYMSNNLYYRHVQK